MSSSCLWQSIRELDAGHARLRWIRQKGAAVNNAPVFGRRDTFFFVRLPCLSSSVGEQFGASCDKFVLSPPIRGRRELRLNLFNTLSSSPSPSCSPLPDCTLCDANFPGLWNHKPPAALTCNKHEHDERSGTRIRSVSTCSKNLKTRITRIYRRILREIRPDDAYDDNDNYPSKRNKNPRHARRASPCRTQRARRPRWCTG